MAIGMITKLPPLFKSRGTWNGNYILNYRYTLDFVSQIVCETISHIGGLL